MTDNIHRYPKLILEKHLDSFGHVNNATYLEMFEEARWDLITNNGFGLKEVQERQEGPVILDVYLKFKKEIRLRDKITIETWVGDYGRRIGKIHQKMVNASGDCLTEATFTFGFFNLKERRLIPPSAAWFHALGLKK